LGMDKSIAYSVAISVLMWQLEMNHVVHAYISLLYQ
jgi:hypothetical protein